MRMGARRLGDMLVEGPELRDEDRQMYGVSQCCMYLSLLYGFIFDFGYLWCIFLNRLTEESDYTKWITE